ncbi:MAG TPA: efflux RND transporter periplasmic adaptor subunit [Bacillota bacterium]
MKKLWIGIGIVIVIIGFVGINVWKQTAAGSVTVDTTTIKEKEIKETVMTPGTLKLANQQTIYFQPERGEIAEFFVKEGDSVKKGTKLFRYENNELTLEKKQNELQIKLLDLELDSVRKKQKNIDVQMKKNKDDEFLQEEYDQIKLQEKQLTIEREQADIQKEMINQQMNDLVVTSDIKGTVITLNKDVSPSSDSFEQQPLMRIGSLNKLVIEGLISEYDTLKIKEGQSVTVTSDALPDQSWAGTVNFISYVQEDEEAMEVSGGESSGVQYPIEVVVEDDLDIKPGFQMVLEIKIEQYEADVIPLTAIEQDGDDNFVYVIEDGVAKRTEVDVGTISDEDIEIKDGLTKQDKVIVNPSDHISDGMEVNVK